MHAWQGTDLILEADGEGDAELGGEGVQGRERPTGQEDGADLASSWWAGARA
jgi:hypothetical protein